VTAPFETRLEMAGEPGAKWLEVRLPDGRPAWVQTGDVDLDPQPLSAPEAVAFASRL